MQVSKELPAFPYLLNEYSIPAQIYSDRYGVAYRNEEILSRITAPSAEEKKVEVEEILWEAVFGSKVKDRLSKEPIKLTATELSKRLQDREFPLRESLKYVGIPLASNHLGRKLGALYEAQKSNGPTFITVRPGYIGKATAWEFEDAKNRQP